MSIRIQRSKHNPIVRPDMDDRLQANINGPSLMQVPEWIENPLGRYYLYFAHHQGTFIRLAYADDLLGPYTVYSPGVLDPAHRLARCSYRLPDKKNYHVLSWKRFYRA